jgi:2-polyprenyl-3-methyl-5-hydroxy-6-metoxy-1,4-benzoquinol methylase
MNSILPYILSCSYYEARHSDLIHLSQENLINHYFLHGIHEGRQSNSLLDRSDFIRLINPGKRTLEIGPFANPLMSGINVYYSDVLSSDELVSRALEHGVPTHRIPKIIHYVSSDLNSIPDTFEYIISSHVIEHQPDLIAHLKTIEKLLSDGGRYFLCVPDKRYCFDHNLNESTIADILQAFQEKRVVHNLKSVIEHRCLTAHNNPQLYWENSVKKIWPDKATPESILNAINEFESSLGSYIDVHAHYFTPFSFLKIMNLLLELNFTKLKVERIYPTKLNNNEFWVILKNGPEEDIDPYLYRLS